MKTVLVCKNAKELVMALLEANGYTVSEFREGWKPKASESWKRGYHSAHGLNYGTYTQSILP